MRSSLELPHPTVVILYQIKEFLNLTISPYLICWTVEVIWIKAVKKSKLLRRNFTVNTFCENAMLWILSLFANYTKHIWATKVVIRCNQHDKNNISFILKLALLLDIKVQLQINQVRKVAEIQMNKCLSLPAGLFFRCHSLILLKTKFLLF